MAWLESHQGLLNHPKTLALGNKMGWNKYETVGHLKALWWWALEYAPTGDLSRFPLETIAEAAGVDPKSAENFYCAMTQEDSKWIDDDEEVHKLHDWLDYAGRYLRDTKFRNDPKSWKQCQQLYNVKRDKKGRRSADNQPTIHRESAAPNITLPNLTVHNQPKKESKPRVSYKEKKLQIPDGLKEDFVSEFGRSLVEEQIPKMERWLKVNAPKKDYNRFVWNWLSRAQSPSSQGQPLPKPRKMFICTTCNKTIPENDRYNEEIHPCKRTGKIPDDVKDELNKLQKQFESPTK